MDKQIYIRLLYPGLPGNILRKIKGRKDSCLQTKHRFMMGITIIGIIKIKIVLRFGQGPCRTGAYRLFGPVLQLPPGYLRGNTALMQSVRIHLYSGSTIFPVNLIIPISTSCQISHIYLREKPCRLPAPRNFYPHINNSTTVFHTKRLTPKGFIILNNMPHRWHYTTIYTYHQNYPLIFYRSVSK